MVFANLNVHPVTEEMKIIMKTFIVKAVKTLRIAKSVISINFNANNVKLEAI